MRRQSQWLIASLLLLLAAAPAYAQRITASIRGTVTDPTSAVVAGATVTVRNEATGLTRTTKTNSAGNYSFDELPVGSYRIDVPFSGFKSALKTGIVVNVADVRTTDMQRAAGYVAEGRPVEASALAVKTVGAEIAGVVNGEQVRELPLNGRNFMQLTLLQ